MKWMEIKPPTGLEHCRMFVNHFEKLSVLVGIENGKWHLSISCKNRYPHWNEIKFARYRWCPDDITMAMILPPSKEYVNVDQNCFHLHEIDGEI